MYLPLCIRIVFNATVCHTYFNTGGKENLLRENLKRLREERRLTQKEIATHLHKSVQAYSQYELGKREPDIDTLIKLADYYQLSLDNLIGRGPKNYGHYFYFADLKQSLSARSIAKIEDYIRMICICEVTAGILPKGTTD